MAQLSDNGWAGIPDVKNTLTTEVLGLKIRTTKEPGVGFLFGRFIQRFNDEVEAVVQPKLDDWSYAYRFVRGSTSALSCHATGTAIDLNALQHVRGKRNTFTAAKQVKLRKVLAEFKDPETGKSIFKWGADFSGIPDDMHFQIQGDQAAVARVVAKIKAQEAVDEMNLSDKVKLTTKYQVDCMNSNGGKYKVGDELTVEYMLFWGGPGIERLYAQVNALQTAVEKLTAVLHAK
jgi:D-alanyl-D-alanine carboxypeptidase